MNSVFDYFLNKEQPSLVLCNPNKTPVASLGVATNKKNTLRFNALSEFSFDFPKSIDNGETTLEAFDLIHNKMLILLGENIGYYIINTCPIDTTGMVPTKHVSCTSLESEFITRRMTGFEGTFNFYNSVSPEGTLLQRVIDIFPGWSAGYIDPDLEDVYRTFKTDNATAYKFLMEDVEKAYSCVFTFDTINKTVSAYFIDNLNANSNVYLSFNNINKDVTLTEYSDEITTALYCYGKDKLTISGVNPLGNNVIYNFDYFKTTKWMSQDLIDAITAWETVATTVQPSYASNLTLLKNYNIDLTTAETDLNELQSQLESYQNIYDVKKAQKLDLTEISNQIVNQQVAIASQNEVVAGLRLNIDNMASTLRKVSNSLQFTTKFCIENFLSDSTTMLNTMTNISSNWTTIYKSSSTEPSFSVGQLNESSPSILSNLVDSTDNLGFLVGLLDRLIKSYPIASSDIDDITSLMNSISLALNELFVLFSNLIPNTETTMGIKSAITVLNSYYDIINYTSNFTDAQYIKLQSFIFQNTYTNENIIITDIMTQEEIQIQEQALYDQGENVLTRASVPRYEFTGNFVNILFLPEYTAYIDALELGKIVTIEVDEDNIVDAVLLELEITYDKPDDFNMVFSNKVRLNNAMFRFIDMFSDTASNSSGVSGITGGTGTTTFSGSSLTSTNILSLNNAQISALGYISFGVKPPKVYGNNEGVWLGYNVGAQMSLYSNANNYMQWTGNQLLIRGENFTLDQYGNITATNANLSGSIVANGGGNIGGWVITQDAMSSEDGVAVMNSGSITGSPIISIGATGYKTGTGVWFGKDDSLYKFYVGDASTGSYIAFDGTTLDVQGITATVANIGGMTVSASSLYTANSILYGGTTPYLSFGATPPTSYGNNVGAWLGYGSGSAQMSLYSDTNNYLQWNGNNLLIKSPYFNLAADGTITATNANISGSLTITSGSFGGWTLTPTALTSADMSLNGVTPAILMDSASGYLSGNGLFMGNDSGTYKFHIGNPSGNYISWDGSILSTGGQWITGSGVDLSIQPWETDIVFASVSDDLVTWTSGSILFSTGVGYNITSGSTGAMSALTYIYLDNNVSSTALQTTTNYNNVAGNGKLLIAAAQNHTNGASILPYSGQQPIINGGAQISASSILAGNIAAGAVTATKINVAQLSAITAEMGNLNVDEKITMDGVNSAITIGIDPPTSATAGTGVWIDRNGITALSASVVNATLTQDGLSAASGSLIIDNSGIRISALSSYLINRAYQFTNSGSYIGGMFGQHSAGVNNLLLSVPSNSAGTPLAGQNANVIIRATSDTSSTPAVNLSCISGSLLASMNLQISPSSNPRVDFVADDIFGQKNIYDINGQPIPYGLSLNKTHMPHGVPPLATLIATSGSVTAGTHSYKITYEDRNITTLATGRGLPGDSSNTIIAGSATNQQVSLTLPIGSIGTIGRMIYRTEASGSTYKQLAYISDNTTTSYTDNIADVDLGSNIVDDSDGSTSNPRFPTQSQILGTGFTKSPSAAYSWVVQSSAYFGGYATDSVAGCADGDTYTAGMMLKSGYYAMKLYGVKTTTAGNIDIYIDGVLNTTATLYNSSTTYGVCANAYIDIDADGWHEIKIKINNKLAASSDYTLGISMVEFMYYGESISGYTSIYPAFQSATYVLATTKFSTLYWQYFATDPTKSLIGSYNNTSWIAANGAVTNQRFHIDLGSSHTIKRIYYENQHASGLSTNSGAKDFILQGSNDATAFSTTTYATDTNWTTLTTSASQLSQHVAADTVDPQYITVTNDVAYRYYALKIANNWGNAAELGFRRIELQTENGVPVS